MTILNPNAKIVEAIQKRLTITNNYCPCLPETEWNQDTLCPCLKFREHEECCCNLYIKSKEEENG